MNPQIRRLFLVAFSMVISLLMASTYLQFWVAPELNADGRNTRAFLRAAEQDRGPIVVAGEAIAQSQQVKDSRRFQRVYPQGPLYATVTGWFSASLNSATRIESASAQVLSGEAPSLWTQRISNLLTGKQRQGGGVELTLNPRMQQAAAVSLTGKRGAVVALNPKTGEILALYSAPTYDPNNLSMLDSEVALKNAKHLENDPDKPLNNRALDGASHAPGSVFKIITTAVMLENGVKADTHLPGPESVQLPGSETRVPNFSGTICGNGNPTLAEAFAISCNTPFIEQSFSFTANQLADKAAAFGFNQTFNVPLLAGESNFPVTEDKAQLGLAAIGQGQVTASPLQMAMVSAAVANDGVLMQPFLVKSVLNADLETLQVTPTQIFGSPLSAEVANTLRDLMVNAVNQPYGTAHALALPGVQVAAKTGTAETGVPGLTNAWITAFAPAEDPQVVVAVIVEGDSETPNRFGSVDGVPIAKAVLEAGLAGESK